MEPTYRAGGVVTVSVQTADTLDMLMTACQGKMSEVGGWYKVHCGAPDSATFEFTDGDVLSSEDQTATPFLTLDASINGITGSFPNPEQGWNPDSAPPLYATPLESRDGNRRLLATPSFDLVPYAAQVQRLMKSALEAARRERSHSLVLPPPFWSVEPGDVCSWTSARNGYDGKLFTVTAKTDCANNDTGLVIQEVDPADYSWNYETDYRPGTSGPTGFPRPEPQGIRMWAAEGVSIIDADGYKRRPGIRLSWDGDMPGVTGVRYKVRRKNDASPVTSGNTLELSAGALIITHSLLPDNQYEVAGQYIPSAPRDMLWSDWIEVATPDVKFSVLDFDAAIKAQITTIQQQVQDFVHATEALIASVAANQDARNWLDKTSVRTQMTARAGVLSATITNVQTVAADATAALASSVESLSVAVGKNTGAITVTQEAVASLTEGIGLSYGVKLDVNGYAVGFQLLNGGADTGSTTFTTDYFQIVTPGQSPKKPFIVSGDTVVLDADNILLNGSVKATKLDVAQLSAINANLGDVRAGTLKSPNDKWDQNLNNGTLIISD
nr:phage tail protein [Nitrobacter winogradskyi]